METQTFFPSTNRRVIIGSPTKQSTTGRICVPIRMPLTGESMVGMPDWVGEAFEAVSQFLDSATPEVEQIADLTLAFANDKPKSNGKLFDDPSVRVPSAELKAFSVLRAGDAEDPDVELNFKVYAPFTRDFWKWLGEMAGAEVYMAFPKSLGAGMAKPDKASQEKLPIEEKPTEAETAALQNDTKPEDTPGTPEYEKRVAASLGADKAAKPRLERVESPRPRKNSKSGPNQLKAYHQNQVAKENRSGRGRATVN
jgi:hypothetical protein